MYTNVHINTYVHQNMHINAYIDLRTCILISISVSILAYMQILRCKVRISMYMRTSISLERMVWVASKLPVALTSLVQTSDFLPQLRPQ